MTAGRPKPSLVKKLEGNRSKIGRTKLRDDPKGIGLPTPWNELSKDELALWNVVVAAMPRGLLSSADDSVLERFCVSWSRFRECQRAIRASGLLVRTPQGPIKNPLFGIMRECCLEMQRAGSEIGLSPAARTRIVGANDDEQDPLEILLGSFENPDGAWRTDGGSNH